MRKKRICSIIGGLLLGIAAHAQIVEVLPEKESGLPDPGRYTKSVYILTGLGPSALGWASGYSNMHDMLRGQGLTPVNVQGSLQLISGGRLFNRLYIEWGTHLPLLETASKTQGNRRLELNQRIIGVDINLGYGIWHTHNSVLVLRAGVGALLKEVNLTEHQRGVMNFADFGQPPAPLRAWPTFYHGNGVFHFAAEWIMGRPKRPTSLFFSGRLGYMRGLNSQAWRVVSPYTAVNAPSDRASYVYISSLLGLSQNRERKSKP